MILRRGLSLILTFCSVLIVPAVASACAVCLGGADGNDPVADAFNWSVLFLMAMPYTILFSVIGFFFYSYRRAAKKARGETEKGTPLRLAWIHKESGR